MMRKSHYNAISNISQSLYDLFIEANVRVQHTVGVKSVIIRRQLDHCCDWCAGLAGIYDYDSAPKDVYRRHDNCRCMVSVKTERGTYQDAWSKKEFKTQREARIKREKAVEDGNNLDELNLMKRRAKDEGRVFVDATEFYLNHPRSERVIEDAKFVIHNGKRKYIDGSAVVFEHDEYERMAIKAVVNDLGGTVEFLPEIKIPRNVPNADVAYNGLRFEIKSPKGSGRSTILNNLKEARRQADNVIMSTYRTNIPTANVIADCAKIFSSPHFSQVKRIIITDGTHILKYLEKV